MSRTEPRPPDSAPLRRGVVAVIVRGDRFLVIERSAVVVAPGAHCFPGGGLEAGESEHEALARELFEELGVIVRPVRRVWQNVTPWRVELAWWLAELPENATVCPNPAEVASVHWLTADEIRVLSPLLPSNVEFLDALARGEISLI
jgi:8-oxo-dGTP diphosphatase